jgi:hypothetical protein
VSLKKLKPPELLAKFIDFVQEQGARKRCDYSANIDLALSGLFAGDLYRQLFECVHMPDASRQIGGQTWFYLSEMWSQVEMVGKYPNTEFFVSTC